jgi:MobA/VirD2-like, nuclease domain
VIGKITAPHGERVEGLIYYLYGPGRREEHTDPHVVAGWRHPAELEPPLRPDGGRDFRRLIGLLNQPHAAMGTWGLARPVWHCSMRAAPGDTMLSDDEWAQVACDVMNRTGLSPFGQEDDAVRWVAIRHGDDHIHIVAMLARQDGRRPRVSNDRYRVREACLAAEERYGLRRTAPGDRTAASRASRAESEKASRRGLSEAPRVTLRRFASRAAAAAASEQEFFACLRRSGVLIRTQASARNPGQLTGYAVALPGDTGDAGEPVWYGGGKLAADLTLPRLRHRWAGPGRSADDPFTAAERSAVWEHAARAADRAAAQIRMLAGTDPAAADSAWATADTLHAAAAALGSQVLRDAADAYDRAARAPFGRIPAPTPAGNGLRRAARLLAAYGYLTSDPSFRPIVLITRLAALVEAVAALRQRHDHAAQAAAALAAARISPRLAPGIGLLR